jgi:hypothetical protein
MPIRATANGTDFIAPLMSDAEWAEMRREVKAKRLRLTMPCCDARGFPRDPKSGTRHFFHRDKETCQWKPETPNHIAIKSEIALACREIGRPVKPEARGEGWRADVLSGSQDDPAQQPLIAFEIQWTRQNLEITEQRQAKYLAAGVQCIWLFRTMPKPFDRGWPDWRERYVGRGRNPLSDFRTPDCNQLMDEQIPLFHLTHEAERGYFVSLGYGLRKLPLHDFVSQLLQRRIAFRPYVRILREEGDAVLDEDFEFYHSRCGSKVCRNETVVRWNHWCFAEGQDFCPLQYTHKESRNLNDNWREGFRSPSGRSEAWWDEV